jgi:hypothetical protein
MELDTILEASSCTAGREFQSIMEPKGSLPHSQELMRKG